MDNLYEITADTLKASRATKEQLEKAVRILENVEKWGDYNTTPIDNAFKEGMTDTVSRVSESHCLINYYNHSSDVVKAAIDMTTICFCGWSLGSLIDKMKEPALKD